MGGARAQFRVKKCLQCSAEPRDPDTDPGALARRRTACSSAAELCALQRSLQQSSAAAAAATCSTEKEERARDLLQTFPRAAAWFPKRGAHTPEPLLLQSAAEQVVRAEQSKALSRGVAQAGGAAAGPRCCCSYPTRVTTMTRASPVTHRKKVEALRPSGLINCFLQSGFLQLWQIFNSQVSQTGY